MSSRPALEVRNLQVAYGGVRALDDSSDFCWITEIALDYTDVLQFFDLLWSPRYSGDTVTAIDQFLQNNASYLTCGSVENDPHFDFSFKY